MDPVIHFELPCDDRERISRFFTEAFGWKIQMFGPESGNYVVVTTAEEDARPDVPRGAIGGGFFPRTEDTHAHSPSIVVAVRDLRKAMQRVTRAGGRVLGEPADIPGIGAYVAFLDTEGNRSSMLQPLPLGGH